MMRSVSPSAGIRLEPGNRLAGGMPAWAQKLGFGDARGTLAWDSDQYISLIGIGGKVLETVLDTGTGRSMIDLGTVQKLGLPWCRAKGKEFGTYSVPG